MDPSNAALRNLERLIERDPLLRDILKPSLPGAKRQARFSPEVDVLEDAEGWTLHLEVAGVAREDIHIDLDGTRLTVRGEKRIGRAQGATVRVTERVGGKFHREFLLPFAVAADRITARLDMGVLEISLPRLGDRSRSDIPIE